MTWGPSASRSHDRAADHHDHDPGDDDHGRRNHHDDKEHDINVFIDLHRSYSDGADDFIIRDHRGLLAGHHRVDLSDNDPANDGTIGAVLRAIHDRRPDLYHDGERQHAAYLACTWCGESDDITFDETRKPHRRPAPGNG